MRINSKIKSYFVWYGMLSPVLFIAVILILSTLQPDYDNLHQTVSELGSPGRPYAFYFNLNFFQFGVGLILLAVALKEKFHKARLGSLYLGIIGMLNIIGGTFQIDLKNVDSLSSILHTLSGLMMFIFFILFFFSLKKTIRRDKILIKSRLPFNICGFIGLLGILFTMIDTNLAGLWQRIFYIGFFGCLWTLAIPLLKENHT